MARSLIHRRITKVILLLSRILQVVNIKYTVYIRIYALNIPINIIILNLTTNIYMCNFLWYLKDDKFFKNSVYTLCFYSCLEYIVLNKLHIQIVLFLNQLRIISFFNILTGLTTYIFNDFESPTIKTFSKESYELIAALMSINFIYGYLKIYDAHNKSSNDSFTHLKSFIVYIKSLINERFYH